VQQVKFELSVERIADSIAHIWQPLYLGSLVCGLIAAMLGYCVMRGLWRLHIVKHIKLRKLRRMRRKRLHSQQ